MGKVRAKTLGNEEQELKEKQEAEARRLAKIEAEKAAGQARKDAKSEEQSAQSEDQTEPVTASESPVIPSEVEGSQSTHNETPTVISNGSEKSLEEISPDARDDKQNEAPKKKVQSNTKGHQRSAKYKAAVAQVEKNKQYALAEALALVEKTHMAKFDETVELHINTTGSVSGSVTLPHGTGKSTRVAILNPNKDATGADALLKEIEAGKINFDILVATPDAMPRLAKVARILGPKGLMPNPKNGTVTPNPEAAAEKYAGGHMTFKTEAKAPVLHLAVGKLSFGADKLTDNIKAALKAVDSKNIKKIFLKSTMSPSVKITA